jgi:hypothetical protein
MVMLKKARKSLGSRLRRMVFGPTVKGEKVRKPKFRTTYPEQAYPDEFKWMEALRVTTKSHRNAVYF